MNIKKYTIIFEPYQDCWYIQCINLKEIDHNSCGTNSFRYHGYICHNELYNTIDEALKNIKSSKPIYIRDII